MYLRSLLLKLGDLLLLFREPQLMQYSPARGRGRNLLNKANQISQLATRRLCGGCPCSQLLHARQAQSPLYPAHLALAKSCLSCQGIARQPRPQSEVAELTS